MSWITNIVTSFVSGMANASLNSQGMTTSERKTDEVASRTILPKDPGITIETKIILPDIKSHGGEEIAPGIVLG